MISFQTGSRSVPGRAIDWPRDKLVTEGTISAGDPDLLQVFDTPQEVINAIFDYYEHTGFEPSVHEQDKLLEL